MLVNSFFINYRKEDTMSNINEEIKNLKKSIQITRICILLLPAIVMIFCIIGKEIEYQNKIEEAKMADTIRYYVVENDTLWSIACQNNDFGISTPDMVHIIKEINNISDDYCIKRGQTIEIPCKCAGK